MSRWPMVPLGELCSITAGGTPARAVSSYYGGSIPWVKIGDMLQGGVNETAEKITQSGLENSTAKILPAGTVLISIFATIGRTAILGVDATTNQAIAGLTPYDPEILLPRYLRRYLDGTIEQLTSQARGVAQVNINSKILKKIKIPLPPLNAQRSVLEILDRADELRAKRRQSIALFNYLAESIFFEDFGNLIENDRSWVRGRVADLVSGFETGKSIAEGDDEDSPYRILKISSITSGIFKGDESKPAPTEYVPPASHFVRRGDLLFSRANTSELIGATAIVPAVPRALLMPDKIWRFAWMNPDDAQPLFVHHLFQQPSFRKMIQRNATGTSGSMKNISKEKVLAIPIGVPPVEAQAAFTSKVQALKELRERAKRQTVELDEFFASLQARAFRNEL